MGKSTYKQLHNGDIKVYRGMRQIAKAAGVSRPTLSRHLSNIEHRRLDGVVLVTESALEHWLRGHDASQKEAA